MTGELDCFIRTWEIARVCEYVRGVAGLEVGYDEIMRRHAQSWQPLTNGPLRRGTKNKNLLLYLVIGMG